MSIRSLFKTKDLLFQSNITVSHTLREGNKNADFMTKLRASSDVGLNFHETSPTGLITLLTSDATGTFFPRLVSFLFFIFYLCNPKRIIPFNLKSEIFFFFNSGFDVTI